MLAQHVVTIHDANREYVIHLLLLKKPHVGKIYPDVADNASQLHFGLGGGVIYANCLIPLQKTVNRFSEENRHLIHTQSNVGC